MSDSPPTEQTTVPTWRNVTVALGTLKPWARNPKSISKRNAKRLLASWDKFGQFQTVAIGPDGEVYDGHQRLSALLTVYGAQYEVAARQSDRLLTESEREELVIAAHVGTTGNIEWGKLEGWDKEKLQVWGMDAETLAMWNADAANLATMLGVENTEVVGPNDFKEFDEDIETEHVCPKCGYRWSGKIDLEAE